MNLLAGLSNKDLLRPFFRRMERRDTLAPEEEEALASSFGRERVFAAGTDIVAEGDRPDRCTLLLSGVTARARYLEGGERQITAFHVPGDFVDLHSFPLKEMDHAVIALTDTVVTEVPHTVLESITARLPHLTRVLWLMTLLDCAINREWLVALGRRSALSRAAHLFVEMGLRFDCVGLGKPSRYHFAVTQNDLADAMGISSVHVNRVVQELRGRGLLVWQNGDVHLPDLQALRELAEFDPRYLHLHREPR